MLVYRCENESGVGMYAASANHEVCKSHIFETYTGLDAIRYEFEFIIGIDFDVSNHPGPRRCFCDSVLESTIYSNNSEIRHNSIFGFSNPSQLFNWLDDVNVLYCLQNVFGIKIVVYEADVCYDGDCQCIFDRRTAKKIDEFHIDEFYRLHQCETIFNPVNQKVIDLCRL